MSLYRAGYSVSSPHREHEVITGLCVERAVEVDETGDWHWPECSLNTSSHRDRVAVHFLCHLICFIFLVNVNICI